MNYGQVNHYLLDLIDSEPEWVQKLQLQAEAHHVPIMDKQGIRLLQQLIRLYQPKRILEIGTAIGYSALRMVEAKNDLQVVTIERNEEMYKQALHNIQEQGQTEHIKVIFGDALETVDKVEPLADFNMIFIDAAKGQYRHFFDLYQPLLHAGGVIVTDNVLFRGFVANPEEAPKRLRNMSAKIDQYNRWLLEHEDYDTVILPVGDGVAISVRRY
ncbi:O-methyltransferase [Gracilibacillus alcaliphilus]|uniref:O-methyltransferase n=1 Tax=Gracilibacillus alcaliphilus TaxID=1401441 RepID=UPI0030841728|nr:putative O-methyltransferase YrrM [Gracilibacillus alcaliphilus]